MSLAATPHLNVVALLWGDTQGVGQVAELARVYHQHDGMPRDQRHARAELSGVVHIVEPAPWDELDPGELGLHQCDALNSEPVRRAECPEHELGTELEEPVTAEVVGRVRKEHTPPDLCHAHDVR